MGSSQSSLTSTLLLRFAWILWLIGANGFCSFAADDWPMWRCDANRSAATLCLVPDELQLLWTREFTPRKQAWDDPLNLDLMPYDRVFEPIVMNGRMFIGFNDADKLMALDSLTGKELWTVYAEAPVRLPPVGWKDRVYFCSDDGYLYCVQAETGELVWKFSGAPNAQHAIGNRRLASAWPARGGPVVRDGKVYFAASIWPFMGTFIYALDADTGKVQWVNDRTGSQYIKQPHSASSFAGVAPQGALVATEKYLVVPGGRTVPAVFDRLTGELLYFELNAGGKGTGGSFVAANDNHFYVHTREKGTREFNLTTGIKTAFLPNEPVLSGESVYSAEKNDKGECVVIAYNAKRKVDWQLPVDGLGDLIQAGNRLFAAGKESITAIDLPAGDLPAKILFRLPIQGTVERLLVANETLFAVTREGHILAYGAEISAVVPETALPPIVATKTLSPLKVADEAKQLANMIMNQADAAGYGLWYGHADSPLVEAIAAESPFVQLAVIDSDRPRVEELRRKLDAANVYGRVTVHHADAASFRAPQYVAHQVFVGQEIVDQQNPSLIETIYQSVRPYGGVMHLVTKQSAQTIATWIKDLKLEQTQVETTEYGVVVRRQGSLPGAADWTHQHGDIANTLKSNDRRVKLPLGLLWFGGSSNTDVLPRHGHGPPEQVVGGRLFIQGINSLSARDVYTGRVLWKRDFEDLGTFDVYFDATFEDVPLDPKYNQLHIPGANGRGTNYVVTNDRVYILEGNHCHVLDPATGANLMEIQLPADESGEIPEWGYIGVYNDVLIGGLGFAKYGKRLGLKFDKDKDLSKSKAGFGSKSLDRAASTELVGFDRMTGKLLWKAKANHSFWHNGIAVGASKIFCLDRNPSEVEDAMRRRGLEMPATYRLAALDYKTGQVVWERKDQVFGTWLGFSEQHDLLLQAGASGSDRLASETGQGMAVYRGIDGSLAWKNDHLKYAGPCIIHNDLIITNANSNSVSSGAYFLLTGKPKLVKNPLTGQEQPWTLTRAYGCNNIIASENMLTFRSGAASFCDLTAEAGTGNLGGFKSGCTSNLVVANGVLNAPDYTRTCSCSYQNQTSLGLVHMPDIEMWSVDTMATAAAANQPIRELAVNFGAPGDRRDAAGRLWLEFPIASGDAPGISIKVNAEAKVFQQHSLTMAGTTQPWILASGMDGITDLKISMVVEDRIVTQSKASGDDDDEPAKKKQEKNDSQLSVAKTTTVTQIEAAPEEYDIRLYFAAPPQLLGTRVFDVLVQGKLALKDVRLEPTGPTGKMYAVHELNGVTIAETLQIQFISKQGAPVLNGIEVSRTKKE